jgi:long-subunit acyl-CoA synthetase (AMP-forming)
MRKNGKIFYSIPKPNVGGTKAGYSDVYFNPQFSKLIEDEYNFEEGYTSLKDYFLDCVRLHGQRVLVSSTVNGEINNPITYKETYEIAMNLGSALTHLGLVTFKPDDTMRKDVNFKNLPIPSTYAIVGTCLKPSIECYMVDIACIMYSYTRLAITDSTSEENIPHMMNQAEMETQFIDEKCFIKLKGARKQTAIPTLKNLIFTGEFSNSKDELKKEAEEMGYKVFMYDDILKIG